MNVNSILFLFVRVLNYVFVRPFVFVCVFARPTCPLATPRLPLHRARPTQQPRSSLLLIKDLGGPLLSYKIFFL